MVVLARSLFTAALLSAAAALCSAEQPLHRRIDEHVAHRAEANNAALGPAADDAEFVRRVYLDLAGRIPTAAEAKAFFADDAPDKRRELVDRLLAGDDYPRRMAELFNVMLMERRGQNEQWTKFLRQVFAQNTHWDKIASAIIHPDADDEALRGAAYFMTARLTKEGAMAAVDVPALTRDVGRLFAGVDLQCAQCHDHVSIDDYTQRDFQGLHMIFENVQAQGDAKSPAIAEKLMTEKKQFMSVFVQQPETTGPRVPGGKEIEIVVYPKEDAYATPPDKKKRTPGAPKFSPLAELARGLTAKENELFTRNIVNRLWFAMMGRGLVEPLDLQHAENPPSHPELLDLLASEMAAHDFDIKWMIRELALSDTYQRTSRLTSDQTPPEAAFAVALQRRISPEQLFRSTLVAAGELERQGGSWDSSPDEIDALIEKSDELKELRELFIKTFANPPKEPELEFAPTVKAALFLMHDGHVLKLLQPREGNLIDRLSKMEDRSAMIDALFLAILSRPPTDEDRADAAEFLTGSDDQGKALSQLAWALLASTEFCVNH